MKKVISIVFTLMILFSLSTQTFAISYIEQFTEYYSGTGVAYARSPFHLDNLDSGADDFTIPTHRVNGPNNQPRDLGVPDLHNGTDFRASAGTNVNQHY